MNICVVTIFNEMNYGAYLQAYAMGEYLRQKGHDVVFYEEKSWGWKESFHALHLRDFRHIDFNAKLLFGYMKDRRYFKKTGDLHAEYDLVIIGSDELWNVRNYNFAHERYYLGEDMKASKCITYAVSCNNCDAEEFSSVYPDLKNFFALDDIAVRDEHTHSLVKLLSNRVPVDVLDPTFLVDYKVNEPLIHGEYLLVYGYYFTEEEIAQIRHYRSRFPNLRMISVGFRHDWCDDNIACSPLEFLNCVSHAKTVVTSTFHGTVFSIIFRRDFITFARNNSKIRDVLNKFNLDKRNVSDGGVESIANPVVYDVSRERLISLWTERSKAFLNQYVD